MAHINPYIHFNGNTEEAFAFYKSVFGGTFGTITRFKDIDFPPNLISENEMNKIMRITLPIGKHTMLEIEKILEKKISEIASVDDPAHDVLHFKRVVKMAIKIPPIIKPIPNSFTNLSRKLNELNICSVVVSAFFSF